MGETSLKRRTILTSIAGSMGAIGIGSDSAIATTPTSSSLSVNRVSFSELVFEANIAEADLPTPPSVTCQTNLLSLDEEMRACAPAHVSIQSGGQLLNTHEGPKVSETICEPSFREIPLEASSRGHKVQIPKSETPSFKIKRQSDRVVVSINETEYSFDEGGEFGKQIVVDSGLRELGEITLNIVLNDVGEVEVLSHPTKSVVPANGRHAQYFKSIADRARNDAIMTNENGRSSPQQTSREGPPEEVPRGVGVTEVQDEGVLLIDHSNGGGAK